MKIDKSMVASFLLLVVIASLYRIMPGRQPGFAPQVAMALFSGSIIRQKKYSFLLPLLSMLVSDIIYELLFKFGISQVPGFYSGQLVNYLLFASVTIIGFRVKQNNILQIAAGSVAAASMYFLLSNLVVWIGGGLDLYNQPYPKTWDGLLSCMAAGLPFYKVSLYATLCFSAVLFGGYYLISKYAAQKQAIA